MKIGDKVRIKDSIDVFPKARGMEGTISKILGGSVTVDFGNIGCCTVNERYVDLIEECNQKLEPAQYQPKHAKEMVNHPDHYNQGKYECIDEMIALFGVEAVIGFCTCNIYKYKTRAPYKNGDEDLKKAEWYMDKLVELQAISTMERE